MINLFLLKISSFFHYFASVEDLKLGSPTHKVCSWNVLAKETLLALTESQILVERQLCKDFKPPSF